jgi:hypothetical protein
MEKVETGFQQLGNGGRKKISGNLKVKVDKFIYVCENYNLIRLLSY